MHKTKIIIIIMEELLMHQYPGRARLKGAESQEQDQYRKSIRIVQKRHQITRKDRKTMAEKQDQKGRF